MNTVTWGDKLTLDYELRLADGKVIESSGDDAAELVIGDGEISEPLEQLLIGLEHGSRNTFYIKASQFMFGMPSNDAIQTLDLKMFGEIQLEAGQLIEFETPDGDEVTGWVESIDGNLVVMDFNHPLIGRDVEFDVTVLNIEKGDS